MSKLVLVRNISGGIFAMPSDSPLVACRCRTYIRVA